MKIDIKYGRLERTNRLKELLEKRVVVLDGATGTAIQTANLTSKDFGGSNYEGCNEYLVITRPDFVKRLHLSYLEAGADIVETNTFGATPLVLGEYGLADYAYEINKKAAELAREAALEYSTNSYLRFVAGSMGPTTTSLSLMNNVSFDELLQHYFIQAKGLIDGGVDYLLLETCQDTLNVKAAVLGIYKAFEELNLSIPIAVSATIEVNGTTLAGQDAESFAVSLMHLNLLYIGLNCATGPRFMRPHIRNLYELSNKRVACVPNAGLPDHKGNYTETPDQFANALKDFVDNEWVSVIGGCCGTTTEHIKELNKFKKYPSPTVFIHSKSLVSGLETVEVSSEKGVVFVGERTNILGSKKFRELIFSKKYDLAAEIGKRQVNKGAEILDVCLQHPDIDETREMNRFLKEITRKVRVPLMIDTTDLDVVETAFKMLQGKGIINSLNLESGKEKFIRGVKLAKTYGAAIVVGLIGEKGMAVSLKDKLSVAREISSLLDKLSFQYQDVWWDPLVFPAASGDPSYIGSSKATLEAIKELKRMFPESKVILGISNISFGLPNAAREIVNSVFLYHATINGLDLAIVNTEKLARYPEIEEKHKDLARKLLFFEGDADGLTALIEEITAEFRKFNKPRSVSRRAISVEERLRKAIIEGSKEHLEKDLREALLTPRLADPFKIINGPLMAGMEEVGRLFDSNQLIIAEVLQSAEVMKKAVDYLKPYMKKSDFNRKGTVLIATVKGDVHDIGKNLVAIVLENNGYNVIDLGTKVDNNRLVEAVKKYDPDIIGLSGLLVKSARQMVSCAKDFVAEGIRKPLIVGGAALSKKFVATQIAANYKGPCFYAKDAMSGLKIVEKIMAGDYKDVVCLPASEDKKTQASTTLEGIEKSPEVEQVTPLVPPDLDLHSEIMAVEEVKKYLNKQMLYGKHMGIKGVVERLEVSKDEKLARLQSMVEEFLSEKNLWDIRALYRFFAVKGVSNKIVVFDKEGKIAGEWIFPRQKREPWLSLADYVKPEDYIALFVVTSGRKVVEAANNFKDNNEYLKFHLLYSLALEIAEAAAEVIHMKIRKLWGIDDPPDIKIRDIMKARYRGKRYSFGYPACPDLEGQQLLFKLLNPSIIGVELTEEFMMSPENSVSAIVFHHPQARYFSV